MLQPFDVSLDKLTVLGNIKDIEAFNRYISTDTNIAFQKDFSNYGYDYKGTIINPMIESSAYYQFNSRKRTVRFEFNPRYMTNQTVKVAYNRFMKHIEGKYLSRIDIAFDFESNLFDYNIFDNVPNRTQTYTLGKGNRLETIYLGARKSSLSICIYDKKKEQEDKGKSVPYNTWNRIEARMQTSSAIQKALNDWDNYNPFHNIQLLQEVPREACSNFQEWVMVKELIKNPTSLSELCKNTRSKYKKLIASIQPEILDLTEIWEQKKPYILEQIQSFLD